MEKTKITDFTTGSIPRHLITFTWPILLSNILQVIYNMVDMIVVGNVLGKAGTGAVAVGGDVTNLLTFIGIGFASAGQVLIARYIGKKEHDKLGKFVGTMSAFLFVCAVVLSVAGLLCQDWLLTLMNTQKEAYKGAVAYSLICMSGLVFIYGYNIVSAILRGMGDSKHPLLFIGIAAGLNLILDLVFVIGCGIGAAGAALATVISQAVSFLLCTAFLIRKRHSFSLNLTPRDFIRWDKRMLLDLLRLGTPMAIKFASVQISKLFVNAWINGYSLAIMAFAGIANKLATIVNLVSNSLNTAGSTMVGQNIVSGHFDRVKRILFHIFIIAIAIAFLFAAAIALFPEAIFSLFIENGDADVLALARPYIPIAILLCLGSALRSMMNALINGSGNYKINFITAILDGFVMRIGLAVLFGVALDMKHMGFWLGDALAGFTPFVVGVVFYVTGLWKKSAKD